MVLSVAPEQADTILQVLQDNGEAAYRIGSVGTLADIGRSVQVETR